MPDSQKASLRRNGLVCPSSKGWVRYSLLITLLLIVSGAIPPYSFDDVEIVPIGNAIYAFLYIGPPCLFAALVVGQNRSIPMGLVQILFGTGQATLTNGPRIFSPYNIVADWVGIMLTPFWALILFGLIFGKSAGLLIEHIRLSSDIFALFWYKYLIVQFVSLRVLQWMSDRR